MATDLKEKPGNQYDEENNPHSRSMSAGHLADSDQMHAELDTHSSNGSGSGGSNSDVARQEVNPETTDGQDTATNDGEATLQNEATEDDTLGKGHTGDEDEKTGIRGKFTRKRAMVGGGVAGTILAIMAISPIATGPLQILNLANIMQNLHFSAGDSASEGRLGKLYTYMRYPGDPASRRIGPIARIITNRVEADFKAKGVEADWDRGKGRLMGFYIDSDAVPALKSAGLEITELDNGRFYSEFDPDGTKPSVARTRLKSLRGAVGAVDLKVGPFAARYLKAKAGIRFFDFSVRKTYQNQKVILATKRAEADIEASEQYDADTKEIISGDNTSIDKVNTTEAEDKDNRDAPRERTSSDLSGGKAKAKAEIQKAAGGIAILGLVCAANEIFNSSNDLREANIVIPLMKTSARILTVASQIKAGDVAFDSLKFLIEDFYDKDAGPGGKSVLDAASIQAGQGEDITGQDLPDSSHPIRGQNFLLSLFNGMPGGLSSGLNSICGAVTSEIGQAVTFGFDVVTGSVVSAAVGELTAVLVGQYADDLAGMLAGESIDPTALKGAALGNAVNYGSLLASNERSISVGGKKLTQIEATELRIKSNKDRMDKLANRSLFDKYFSKTDPESLFARTAISTSNISELSGMFNFISSSPSTVGSSINGIFNIFSNKAYAQTDFSYGLPTYGFSLSELDDPRFENPLENEDKVKDLLDDSATADKIEKCFGLTVTSDKGLEPIEGSVLSLNKERDESGCDDDDDENWTRIRIYILDEHVATTAACMYGESSECERFGFDTSSSGSGSSGTANSGGEIVGDPYSPSADIECDPRTIDLGNNHEAYIDGTPVPARLCALPNISSSASESTPGNQYYIDGADGKAIVNSRVSGAWFSLIEKANSENAGLQVYSAFRPMAHQEYLCSQDAGCSSGTDYGETGQPGYSGHQAGVALDFTGMGVKVRSATCSNPATSTSPGYVWLRENAFDFGFKQYAVEAWHWDASNDASRCSFR